MEINADFGSRVVVRFAESDWVPSPAPGVERKMLDRIGGEVARATTIVRFAPGSAFSAHTHDGGEEFIVLDGVFQDEHGDFGVGSYIRNPPTSRHTPAAAEGATIFVKLHQFDPADRVEVRTRMPSDACKPQTLFSNAEEEVTVTDLLPGTTHTVDARDGAEVFVLSGSVEEGGDTLGRWDWLRLPPGPAAQVTAGSDGARIWTKSGHLAHVRVPA